MNQQKSTLLSFVGKNALLNGITYLIFGLVASTLFNYREVWAEHLVASGYRPISSPWVMAGPILQPIRGAFYGLILWPFRNRILELKRGWLALFGLFFGLGIFGTFAAPLSSFEGLIYTSHPIKLHLLGLPEICGHALLYSWLLFHWEAESKISPIIIRSIRSVAVSLLSMIIYIGFGLTISALSGVSTGEATTGQYIAMFLSAVLMILLGYVIQLKVLKKWKAWGLLSISMVIPLLIQPILSGSTMGDAIGLVLLCGVAVIPGGLILGKKKEASKEKSN